MELARIVTKQIMHRLFPRKKVPALVVGAIAQVLIPNYSPAFCLPSALSVILMPWPCTLWQLLQIIVQANRRLVCPEIATYEAGTQRPFHAVEHLQLAQPPSSLHPLFACPFVLPFTFFSSWNFFISSSAYRSSLLFKSALYPNANRNSNQTNNGARKIAW
jgi:hypothetical protein